MRIAFLPHRFPLEMRLFLFRLFNNVRAIVSFFLFANWCRSPCAACDAPKRTLSPLLLAPYDAAIQRSNVRSLSVFGARLHSTFVALKRFYPACPPCFSMRKLHVFCTSKYTWAPVACQDDDDASACNVEVLRPTSWP